MLRRGPEVGVLRIKLDFHCSGVNSRSCLFHQNQNVTIAITASVGGMEAGTIPAFNFTGVFISSKKRNCPELSSFSSFSRCIFHT